MLVEPSNSPILDRGLDCLGCRRCFFGRLITQFAKELGDRLQNPVSVHTTPPAGTHASCRITMLAWFDVRNSMSAETPGTTLVRYGVACSSTRRPAEGDRRTADCHRNLNRPKVPGDASAKQSRDPTAAETCFAFRNMCMKLKKIYGQRESLFGVRTRLAIPG